MPFEQDQDAQIELDTLMHTQATLSEELLSLAEMDPPVAITLPHFCVGPRLNYWFRALPLHWEAAIAERKDHLTLDTVDRLVQDFALQRGSPRPRIQVEKQVSLPTRLEGMDFFYLWNNQPAAVIAA